MKCPKCGSADNGVVDSRWTFEAEATRRRRKCNKCGGKFTTYEVSEDIYDLMRKVVESTPRRKVIELDNVPSELIEDFKNMRKKGFTRQEIDSLLNLNGSKSNS